MCTVEVDWNYEFDIHNINNNNLLAFELQMNNLCESVLISIENSFRGENYSYHGMSQNNNDDLRNIMENNNTLRQDIDVKLQEFQQQQGRYETIKQDQKLLSQVIKEKHEAFLMAKKFYKKILRIHYTIENKSDNKQTIFVQFFTEAKKDSENHSLRLLRNLENGTYELLSTNPALKNFKEIQRKLQESKDVPGALCCIRQSFIATKGSKKH